MSEIEKIKFHIKLISESIDTRDHPIPSLVISKDWSEDDLDAAHDIFQKFDEKLESGADVNWVEFEGDFKKRFGMSYQGLKSVVLAFFWNGQWSGVCHAYATEHHCVEFSEITRNRNSFSSLEEQIASILIKNNIDYFKEHAINLRNGDSFRLDFLVTLPQRKIAIEAKSSRSIDHALSTLKIIANVVKASEIANEFWIVTEQISRVDKDSINQTGLKIISIDELEKNLTSN